MTACISFFWIFKMIHLKTIILKKTFLDTPLLIFMAVLVLSTVFSIDVHTSIFGYYGRFNGGLLSIFSYIILFYAFVSNFKYENLDKFLKTSLFSSFIVMLWGLPGRFNHDMSCLLFMGQWNNSCWTDQFHPEVRMFSTLGQPNWLGAYLTINLFIAVFLLLKYKFFPQEISKTEQKGYISKIHNSDYAFNWQEYLLFGYILLNFICILFTRSRSSILAAICGLTVSLIGIVLLYVYYHKLKELLLEICKWLLIILIPIFIFKTGITFIDNLIKFPELKSNQPKIAALNKNPINNNILISESFDIRKIVWKGAVDLGNKYPLLGTGPETFAYSYYFIRPLEHNYVSEWDYLYNKAHNEYLNYLATTGYLGLFSYVLLNLVFIFWVVINIIKISFSVFKEKIEGKLLEKLIILVCLSIAYVSILLTNFFGFSTTTINLFFFIIPAILYIFINDNNIPEKNLETDYSNKQTAVFVTSTFLLLLVIFFIIRYWIADTLYAKADIYIKSNDYQTASTLLNDALNLKYEHVYEDKLSYALANLALLASYQKKDEMVGDIIKESSRLNDHSLVSSPKNILYWKTKAKNNYLFYQISLQSKYITSGIDGLKQAFTYSPTDPKIPYSLAIFYSLLYDDAKNISEKENYIKQSVDNINLSIKLKTNYRDAYFLKGQLLKKFNQKKEAKETFQYILDKINKDDTDAKKEITEL